MCTGPAPGLILLDSTHDAARDERIERRNGRFLPEFSQAIGVRRSAGRTMQPFRPRAIRVVLPTRLKRDSIGSASHATWRLVARELGGWHQD